MAGSNDSPCSASHPSETMHRVEAAAECRRKLSLRPVHVHAHTDADADAYADADADARAHAHMRVHVVFASSAHAPVCVQCICSAYAVVRLAPMRRCRPVVLCLQCVCSSMQRTCMCTCSVVVHVHVHVHVVHMPAPPPSSAACRSQRAHRHPHRRRCGWRVPPTVRAPPAVSRRSQSAATGR